MWLGARNYSAECFVRTLEGVFPAREVRRLEQQDWCDKELINDVIGDMADGRWTVDRPGSQGGSGASAICRCATAKRKNQQDIETGAGPGCNASKDGKRPQAHSDQCRSRIEASLKETPQEAERLDRRLVVFSEAFAKQLKRSDSRKSDCGEEGMECSSQQEMRESPRAPDPDARRITMKSSPVPVVPDPDASKRITVKSSSPARAPAISSGRQSTDTAAESRMSRDDDIKANTNM